MVLGRKKLSGFGEMFDIGYQGKGGGREGASPWRKRGQLDKTREASIRFRRMALASELGQNNTVCL